MPALCLEFTREAGPARSLFSSPERPCFGFITASQHIFATVFSLVLLLLLNVALSISKRDRRLAVSVLAVEFFSLQIYSLEMLQNRFAIFKVSQQNASPLSPDGAFQAFAGEATSLRQYSDKTKMKRGSVPPGRADRWTIPHSFRSIGMHTSCTSMEVLIRKKCISRDVHT